jgi:hypothetical protein
MWKSKSQIDEHLQTYYETEKEKVDKRIEVDYVLRTAKFEQQIAKDMAKYEHTYHSGMEERNIVLAKLDAEIAHKKELLEMFDKQKQELLTEKSNTILRLLEVIEMLAPFYEKTVKKEEAKNG